MIRFFLTLLFITLVLLAVSWVSINQQWINERPSYFFHTLIFLLFGTSLLYVYLYKFNRPGFFIQLYLLTTVVKILAYGTYNFLMILGDKKGATQNVAWFMAVYFIFTCLEIGFLHSKIANDRRS